MSYNESLQTANERLREVLDAVRELPADGGLRPETMEYIDQRIVEELALRGQVRLETAESVEWLEANGDPNLLYVLVDENDSRKGEIFARRKTTQIGGPGYTNLLPTATDTDGVTIYGGDYDGDGTPDGYKTATRLSGSGGNTISATELMCATGFIPASDGGVVRVKNTKPVSGVSSYLITYDSAQTRIAHTGFAQSTDDWSVTGYQPDGITYEDGVLTIQLSSAAFGTGIAYIRISGHITADTIITCNEEISEGGGTVVVEQWASLGISINAGDYDEELLKINRVLDSHTAELEELRKGGGSSGSGSVDPLALIRNWDAPIYDRVPAFLLSEENPAVSDADKTVDGVYAKYDELMAANPRYITRTDMGLCSDGVTHVYRYDFCEPEPHHQSGMQWSETKPTIIIVSGSHGELGGIYGLFYALKAITENPELDDLRRNVHFVVVPVMNPYCMIGPYNTTYAAQNANGVEIHRNFEVGFKYPGESGYIEPGNRSHGGTEPLSEPESQYIDNLFNLYPDAALFLTCHSAQRDTQWGTGFIWASTATNYTCNLGYRLVDKMSKAWHGKYGEVWDEGCARENAFVLSKPDTYPNAKALDEGDYRVGHAHVSATNGTETRQATKYGIQGANVEVLDTFWVLSSTALDSKVTTHGAEVYINYLLMYMGCYDHKDKGEYYIHD